MTYASFWAIIFAYFSTFFRTKIKGRFRYENDPIFSEITAHYKRDYGSFLATLPFSKRQVIVAIVFAPGRQLVVDE